MASSGFNENKSLGAWDSQSLGLIKPVIFEFIAEEDWRE